MFQDERLFPYKSNIIMFDSSGEYYNAFRNLSSINPNYNYRFISTNETEGLGEQLRLPIYLLNVDDMALLLNATNHSQLPIIERMLKLAKIFSEDGVDSNAFKNHLIAKAIMTILYTNETSPNKRNEIFSILASCSTAEFNLEAEIKGIGYTRKFRDCFLIDQFGNFTESVLMTEYISSFIKDEYDSYEPKGNVFYNLDTLEKALNFTLISEGWLRNENTYGDSVTLKVRLHSLITGENAKFFDYKDYVTLEQYISSLLIVNGKKYQLVNINLDDVDDVFAKVIVKIYSRLIFSFSKSLGDRASIPFHLIVEEAHRYIQNDKDTFLIGYNIFDRIAKEGRKYGVILGLITQRPVEMSDTVISQCSNFLIFKINHPADVDYIRKMVPNISDEIIEKQKTLQAGTCLAFGQGFKIPLIVKLEMPNPEPRSGNCDVVNIWDGNTNRKEEPDETDEEYVKKVEEEVNKKLGQNSVPETPKAPAPIENKEESNDEPDETEEDTDKEVEEEEPKEEENIEESDDANEEEPDESNDETEEDEDEEETEDEEDSDESDEDAEEEDDDSIIIPAPNNAAPVEPASPEETQHPVENNNPVTSMEDINSNILAGLSNLQQNAVPSNEQQVQTAIPEVASNLVASATPPVQTALPLNNNVSAGQQISEVPDANIGIPQVTPPANAENINLRDNFAGQTSLNPNVKQEVVQPSVIIPGGQNVDNSILAGFGGQAQMAENTENKG